MRAGGIIALTALIVAFAGYGGVARSSRLATEDSARALTGGQPGAGREAMVELGCVACHQVPGVFRPKPQVGPSLDGFALRPFVAGVTENAPEQLVKFIRDPRAIAPRSAMPKLPMSEQQARDLAAFLYTLR